MPNKRPVKCFAIAVLLLLALTSGFAQSGNWLDVKIKGADSVILVSHHSLLVENETPGGERGEPRPRLIIGGKINYRLVKERRILNDTELTALLKVLKATSKQTIYSMHGCFDPHHAIFIIKNGKVSYIDLCFGCDRFESSADLQELDLYETRKWVNLHNYFKKLGFKHEMKK